MQKFKITRFVLHPVTGTENDALRIDNALFDVHEIWYACMYGISAVEFYNLTPVEMADIAMELFSAEMIDEIK